MTDRDMIDGIFQLCKCKILDKEKSLIAGGRRFFFNSEGEVWKIADANTKMVSTETHTYKNGHLVDLLHGAR